MERITKRRAIILFVIFLTAISLFTFQLYNEQIIKTGGSTDNTATFTYWTRVKAARGDILDRNGNLLVSNRASYDLVLNHYVLLSADDTNEHLYRLAKRCREQGIEYADHFPISEERPFTYELDTYNSSWQGYFQTYLAEKANLDSDITAPLLVEKLRQKYKFPPNWTEEEARQVIGLRYELDLRRCVESLSMYTFLPDATDQELSAIVELNVPGMSVEASTVREYNTKYAAHILGYVGAMSAEQWEHYKEVPGYEMDSQVGQDGLEAAYEEYLHGVDGWREDTVTTDGKLVSSKYLTEPQAGSNVEVSIDIGLQRVAEDKMAEVIDALRNAEPKEDGTLKDGHDAEGGAVVVQDVKTGQILACASYPTYDLEHLFEDYDELSKDPYKPFYNRALLATYPPGSTYKMSMVVAGMQAKRIDSSTIIEDKGAFTKYADDNFKVYCLQYSNYGNTHGKINAAQALQVSCNYFFYELADGMRIEDIDSTAKGLGLGEPTGVELPEYIGHRANPETKKELYPPERAGWYAADQILASIGQSDNRFTPMQLCVYASTLANQGMRYKATFMNRVVSSDYRKLLAENTPVVLSKMEIDDETYRAYTEGMHRVTQHTDDGHWGTAVSAFKGFPIPIAAKTGTAQTGIDGTSDNGAFVCFAPMDEPQIAISVYVEKGGHGSTLATIARSILENYFSVDEVGDLGVLENRLS